MADETKAEIKQPDEPQIHTVERNGVSIDLQEARTTKGKNPGKTIYEPVVDLNSKVTIEVPKFLKWMGVDNLLGMSKKLVRSFTGEWVEEATNDETGVFNTSAFISLATNWDATGETMEDLRDTKAELDAELLTYDTDNDADTIKIMACFKKLQDINRAIAKKSRPRKSKAAEPTPA